MKRDRESLDLLAARLSEEKMPVLSQTARLISKMSLHDHTPVSELTWGILRDPLLTARVLRLANSIFYNRERRRVSTVSRAVLQLGFDTIRSICISASWVENLLKGPRKERTILEMLKAFHAAVQARGFAASRKDPAVEEIFIAALLYNIGRLAFWSFGGEMADALDKKIKQNPDQPPERLEQEVLGFRLQELTERLIKDWGLGGFIERMALGDKTDPRAYSIVLGYKVTEIVSQTGTESPEFSKITNIVGSFLNLSAPDVAKLIKDSSREAAHVAKDYGLESYIKLLAQPTPNGPQRGAEEPESARDFLNPDPVLQLELLGELSTLAKDKPFDINLFLSTLLEGISRGIGMDRVLFSVVEKHNVVGRYGLGWDQAAIEHFICPAESPVPSIFGHVIETRAALWVDGKKSKLGRYLTSEVRTILSTSYFFIMPLIVKSKVIGLICADRSPSGGDLDEASFSSFQFFSLTANAILQSVF